MSECTVGEYLEAAEGDIRARVYEHKPWPHLEMLYAQFLLDTRKVQRLHAEVCESCRLKNFAGDSQKTGEFLTTVERQAALHG